MDVLEGFSKLHSLNNAEIDAHVASGYIGIYVLDKDQEGPFSTDYVGRSDTDVADRLKQWVAEGGFLYFKVKYEATKKAAYELECQIYHTLKPVKNKAHPDAPNGLSYTCPYCPTEKSLRSLYGL